MAGGRAFPSRARDRPGTDRQTGRNANQIRHRPQPQWPRTRNQSQKENWKTHRGGGTKPLWNHRRVRGEIGREIKPLPGQREGKGNAAKAGTRQTGAWEESYSDKSPRYGKISQ